MPLLRRELMQEMAHAGEDHGKAEAVGGGDDIVVAHGASGLNDCGGAGLGGFFDAVREREEGVGCDDAALQRRLRFHYCDFDGVDAAHLAGADSEGGAVASEDDGIGFYVFADFPGEAHGVHLLLRGDALGDGAQVGIADFDEIGLLHEHAAEDALELELTLASETAVGQFE